MLDRVAPPQPYAEYRLPRVRKMFIPDPGHIIIDADLSGADAQVVAWEADDAELKAAFRAGVKIHEKNATDVFGDRYTSAPGDRGDKGTAKGLLYDQNKRAVHATNYLAHYTALVLNPDIRWTDNQAQDFQRTWFTLHPGIKTWQQRVISGVYASRTVRNQFGYRIIFYDRVQAILPEAVAWGPQSTVAEVCFRGALQVEAAFPWVDFLLQVHDSLVFQIPYHREDSLHLVWKALHNPVPYADPLVIQWGMKWSRVSWGDCDAVPKELLHV